MVAFFGKVRKADATLLESISLEILAAFLFSF